MENFEIREAHWSNNPSDSHTKDDADCTYIIFNKLGQAVSPIFSKFSEAEKYLRSTLE